MSLVFCDSFDHYDTAGLAQKYFATTGGSAISAADPRTGIQCLLITGAFGPTIAVNNLQTLVFGTAVNPVAGGAPSGNWVAFNDGFTNQIRCQVLADGSIKVVRANDPFPVTLGQTGPGIVPAGSYTYLEVALTIDSLVGSVIIRANETVVLTLTNVNTQASGNAYCNLIQLMGGGGQTWLHDDVYLLDSVAPNNSFLGAISVYACMPNADAAPIQWTPSGAGDNYQQVNEVPQSELEFVSSDNVGDVDQYLYDTSAITPPVTVFAVQHSMLAALDSAGAHELDSNLDGISANAPQSLTTSYVYKKFPFDKRNGVDWTLAGVASAEFGPELAS